MPEELSNQSVKNSNGVVQIHGDHNTGTVTIIYQNGEQRTGPFLAPPPPPYGLVGRDDLLHRLKQQLFDGGSLVLHGLPGVGKTAVATALANDPEVITHFCGRVPYRGDVRRSGILWATLGRHADITSITSHLAKWAGALGIPPDQISKLKSVEDYRPPVHAAIGWQRMLLVVDDAWQHDSARAFQVGGPNCTYIITTRLPEVALALDFPADQLVKVEELGGDEGLALLQRLAPEAVEAEPNKAHDLVQAVGGLPLALILMGKYLHQQGYSRHPQRRRSAFARLNDTVERLKVSQPPPPFQGPASLRLSLLDVIGISDEALDEALRHVLRALSVFAPKPSTFSQEAALAVASAPIEALYQLDDHGLLEIVPLDHNTVRYTLHNTIVDYARSQLTDTAVYERVVEFFVSYVEGKQHDYPALALETTVNKNMLAALQIAYEQRMPSALARGTIALSQFLINKGLYNLAEEHLKRAEEVVKSLTPQSNTEASAGGLFYLAHTAQRLGELTLHRGDYRQAGEQALQAMALVREFTKRRGAAQEEAMESVNSLFGSIHELLNRAGASAAESGDNARAETFYQAALTIARQLGDRRKIIESLLGLGGITVANMDYEQAEGLYQDAFTVAQELENYFLRAVVLEALSALEASRGEPKRAEEYIRQMTALMQQRLESIAQVLEAVALQQVEFDARIILELGSLLTKTAAFLYERGNYTQAREIGMSSASLARHFISQPEAEVPKEWRSAIRQVQDAFIRTLKGLSILELEHREYEQAEQYVTEALSLAREIDDREKISGLLLSRGQLNQERKDFNKARECFRDALHLAREMRDSRLTSEILLAVGRLDLEQQQPKLAFEAFTEALEVARAISNLDLVAAAQYGLAQVSLARGNVDEAERIAQESISVFEAIHNGQAEGVKQWLVQLRKETPM